MKSEKLTYHELAQKVDDLEHKLAKTEWLLEKDNIGNGKPYIPYYGDVTKLNTQRTILDAVGKEMLETITSDLMDLLDTSVAIYEKNGDYAYGVFNSGWCQLLDASSRKLCNTTDNKVALTCGKWLCHDDCWKNSAMAAIKTKKSTDTDCVGAIKLFAEPILKGNELIGVINIGYGNPPSDDKTLQALAEKYLIDFETLKDKAFSYKPRPDYIIDLAKKRLKSIAKLIGEIVSRKQAEIALEQSEQQFRGVLENIQLIGVMLDTQGKIIFANDYLLNLTGWSRNEVIGKDWFTTFLPRRLQKQVKNFFDVSIKKGGMDVSYLNEIITKNGHERFINWNNTFHSDENKNIISVTSIGEDITEVKAAINQNEFLSTITQQAINCIITTDVNFKIKWVNNAFTKLYQYSKNEVLGKTPDFLNAENNAEDIQNQIYTTIKNGKIFENISLNKRKDNSTFYCKYRVFPIFDASKKIIAYSSIQEDVTKQKELESTIKQNEEKYRLLLENAGAGIGYYDLNGNVILFNKQAADYTNGKPEDFAGKNLIDLYGNEHGHFYLKRIREAAKSEKSIEFNDWIELIPGNKIHFTSTHTRVKNNDGKIIGVQIISRDTTQQKNAEENLKEAKKIAEESDKKFQLIVNQNPFPLAVTDSKIEKILFWSDSATKKLGHKPKTVPEWFEVAYPNPEYRKTVIEKWFSFVEEAAKTQKATFTGEYDITCKNGSVIIGEFYVQFIPGQLIITFNDITERKKAEKELIEAKEIVEKNEENLKSIVENATNVFYKHDIKHRLTYLSPQIKAVLGYEIEEAKVLWTDLTTNNPINEIGFNNTVKAIETGKKQDVYDLELLHKNGSKVLVEVREAPIVKNGKTVEIVGALADVTEKRKIEQDLKQSEEEFRALVNSIPEMVFMVDKNFRITFTNQSAAFALHKKPDKIIGELIDNLFDKETAEIYKTDIQKVFQQNKPMYKELPTRIGGQKLWINVSLAPVILHGKAIAVVGVTRNVTDKKEIEIALQNSEERFQLAMDASADGIFDWNIKTNELYFSPGYFAMLGYNYNDLPHTYNTFISLLHPDDRKSTEEKIQNYLEGKSNSTNIEMRLKTKSGDWNWILSRGKIVERDKNGNPLRFVGTNTNIHANKMAGQALKESEKKYRGIFENSALGIFRSTPEGRYEEVNPAFASILGFGSPSQMIEDVTDISKLYKHAEDREKIKKEFANKGFVKDYIVEASHPQKETVWISINAKQHQRENGQIYYEGTIQDITERKKAELGLITAKEIAEENEKKIRLNESRLEALVELSQMTSKTNDEIHDFTLNKAIELTQSQIGFLGFVNDSESEVEIYKWSDNAMKECAVNDYNMNFIIAEAGIWGDVIRTRKPLVINNYKAPNKNKKGTPKGHVAINNYLSIPTFSEGKIVAIISVANKNENYSATDINQTTLLMEGMRGFLEQRSEKEQLIKAKQKAEEADRLKSAFLANMSHEIRTPMNGILGFTELLKEPNLTGDQQEKYIEIIRKSGARMLDTVNDIIDISKIDSGQVEISNNAVNINDEIQAQYVFFKQEALKKGLEFKLNNKLPEINSFISTDKVKLNSIISNLIKNAIKYTDSGCIEISCSKKSSALEVKIIDTGIGIPKNRIHSIFNRFEQADISDIHAREGSGLGLSIAKSYAEMLGGNITVESEEGKGSTFCLTIPWVENQKKETGVINTRDTNNQMDRKFNILIVEDDDISFEHLKIITRDLAKNTYRTTNGKDAVEFVRKNTNTHLVLMDIKLPVLNGIEATKEIRKFNKNVIIIAQTAYGFSDDKEMAVMAGCNDYIAKPIYKEKLLSMITKYLKIKV